MTRLCAGVWPEAGDALEVTAMTGGASTRKYYRVTPRSGGGKSAVAMFVPDGPTPEEVHNGHLPERWPFLEVRDLLEARGVDVPRVLAEDTSHGWLVLEDLGEDTLANYLSRVPGDKPAIYTCAVQDLSEAQASLADLPEGSIVGTRRFDYELLRWEIEHFREWGLDARKKPLLSDDAASFASIADGLAKKIAGLPVGFTNRDYQSRNLMVRASPSRKGKPFGLVWLDFQDSLLGPRVYDLVALLNDSYQTFDRAFVEARLGDYADRAGLVIYIGVNDVWHKTLLGTGTDADKFEKFYQAIINKLSAKGIKAILCTPAVVGEKTDMSNQLDGDLNRYSNIIRDLAKKNNLPLVDLRKKFLDYLKDNNPKNEKKNILTYDRVHMNDKGNQFIADQMWKVIKDLK